MRIYDISKSFFHTPVYPGDPVPEAREWFALKNGDGCNLHMVSAGTHHATHMDAPFHFLEEGAAAADIPLEKCVGRCSVFCREQPLTKEVLAGMTTDDGKLLIRGQAVLTPEGAEYLAERRLELFGTEINTVGDEKTGEEVHKILLSAGIVILENLDLTDIPEGRYFLFAQPLKLEHMDGSPVRAILIADDPKEKQEV